MCRERRGVQKSNPGEILGKFWKIFRSMGNALGVGRMALKIPQTRTKAVFTFV